MSDTQYCSRCGSPMLVFGALDSDVRLHICPFGHHIRMKAPGPALTVNLDVHNYYHDEVTRANRLRKKEA